MTPGTGNGVADPCEHQDQITLYPEEFASLSEGICHNCKAPGQTVDGWSVCTCCGTGWRMTRDHLFIRIAFVIEDPSGRGVS